MYLQSGKKEECTGCGACVDCCPKGCISLCPDQNGFVLPVVDKNQCINCKLCEKVCPDFKVSEIGNQIRNCQYAINPDRAVTDHSTSGGVFYELAKHVIEDGGVVFGAAWTEKYQLRHICATTLDELKPLMGSKYVQSDCTGVYSSVKNYLKEGKRVLFVGTPCQVAGLKKFIGQGNENLLLVDILCHGVPSQKLFDQWVDEEEAKNGKIVFLKFRDKKKYGWQHCLTYVTEKNGRIIRHDVLPAFNPYYHLFMTGYTLRDSCYACRYACEERVGDITLGDYWGAAANKAINYLDMKNGVSLVLCNTEKGTQAVHNLSQVEFHSCDFEKEKKRNLPLREAVKKPLNRDVLLEIPSLESTYNGVISRKAIMKEKIKKLIPRKLYYFVSGQISKNTQQS